VVPLPATYSRGDQIDNARYFESRGICAVIEQSDLTPNRVQSQVASVLAQAPAYRTAMVAESQADATQAVLAVLQAVQGAVL
jgi:UDP-N-acetylglucosamine--N-acetylmuramyl-(pentapeptide) pyrophosphoryl-undecaprenol N-acetylglucosamine transferase